MLQALHVEVFVSSVVSGGISKTYKSSFHSLVWESKSTRV